MATSSFHGKGLEINNEDVQKFHDIMNNKKKVVIEKVNHKAVTDREEILRLFKL